MLREAGAAVPSKIGSGGYGSRLKAGTTIKNSCLTISLPIHGSLWCPLVAVVVRKGFRASTVRASELREIGPSTLAMKADKRERRCTSRASRMVAGHQGIKQKILGWLHGRSFQERGCSLQTPVHQRSKSKLVR